MTSEKAEISSVRSAAGAPPVLAGSENTDGTIESQAGDIVGQYSCVYEAVNGVLYAGSKALYFVGSYFLFDKKIRLPWELIRQVVKMDQGVQIITKMDDIHTFGSMRQAEKVWPVLINLHNDALLDRKVVPTPTPADRTRSILRRNSDPASTLLAQQAVAIPGPPIPTKAPDDEAMGRRNKSDLIEDDDSNNDDLKAADIEAIKAADSTKPTCSTKPTTAASPEPTSSTKTTSATEPTSSTKPTTTAATEPTSSTKTTSATKSTPAKKPSSATKPSAAVAATKASAKPNVATGKPSSAVKPALAKKTSSGTKKGKPPAAVKPAATPGKLAEAKAVSFPVQGLSPEESSEKVGDRRLPPIHCTHDNVKGTLYVGNNGAYFYGRRYLWDIRKLFFPFGAIKQVQIVRSAPGICFTNKEGHVFAFTDMDDPDAVWASMIAFHQKVTAQKEHAKAKMSFRAGGASHRGSLFRMNSDPNMGTPSPLDGFQASKSRMLLKRIESNDPPIRPAQPSVDLAKEWATCEAKKKDYPNLVVEKLLLKCSLDGFFDRFYANDAKYSLANYLESRGDSELKATEWKKVEPGPGKLAGQKRIVHYKHPVNAPLAPPQAGARKEQTLTRYGKHGICVETRTIVDDVPMADCFHVDDRIRVEPKGSDEVLVTMEFEITFVKSTMFKSIISKTTKGEFSDFFNQMGEYMTQALGGEPKPPPKEPEPVVPVPVEPTGFAALRGGVIPLIHPAFTALVILLQLFILRELRVMRYEYAAMRQQVQIPVACIENVPTLLGGQDQENLAKAEL